LSASAEREHLNEAMKIRKDFNSTRTTYHWSHLKNCKYY
jgi:hypothetical protein